MAFSRLNPGGWTDDIDTITAYQVNGIDVNQSRAVDGTGGGTYTPVAPIIIAGTDGLQFAGTGNGAYPRLNALTVVRRHHLSLAGMSAAGAAVLQQAAGGVGSITGVASGNTIVVPHILTTHAAGVNEYHVIEIERPLDGATLADVAVMMGYLATGAGNYAGFINAQFDIIRWSVGSGGVTIDSLRTAVVQNDDFSQVQAEAGDRRLQTVAADQNNVIDSDLFRYGIYVEHPHSDISGLSRMFVYDVRSTYTVGLLQPA